MKKIPQFQAKLNNELILYYSIPPINDLKLFGEDFVIKNKNKCKLLILDADHVEHEIELCAYINPDELFLQNNIIIIFLVQTDYFTDLSFMFHKCENLIMVSGFSNIATEYVTNMKGMFEYCTKLKKLDDISNLKTGEVIDMSQMFGLCTNLIQLPDLSSWKTNNVKI